MTDEVVSNQQCLMVCKPHGKRQGWLSKGSEWTIENQQTQALTFFSESGDTDDYCLLMEDGQSWRPYGPDRDIRIRHCESSCPPFFSTVLFIGL